VIHKAVLGQCERRAVGSAPTARRVHWPNNVLGNRTSAALRGRSGASPHQQGAFGSLAPATKAVRVPRPTNRAGPESHSHTTDERELIPTSSRCAAAGLLEDIIVNGIDRCERDASDVGIRYAYAESFFDADH